MLRWVWCQQSIVGLRGPVVPRLAVSTGRSPTSSVMPVTLLLSGRTRLRAGGRAGGSITAALFLKEFVKEGVEWAHLDIAGPVSTERRQAACSCQARFLYAS